MNDLNMAQPKDLFTIEAQEQGLLKAVIVINSKGIDSNKIIDRLKKVTVSPKVLTLSAYEGESTDTNKLYDCINSIQPIVINAIDMPRVNLTLIYSLEALGYVTSTIYLESDSDLLVNRRYDKYSLKSDLLALNCNESHLTDEVLSIFSQRINSFFCEEPLKNIIYSEIISSISESKHSCLVPTIYTESYLHNLISLIQEIQRAQC